MLMSMKSASERVGRAWSRRSRIRRDMRAERAREEERAETTAALAGPAVPV
jgi:hypothetical protein